jgi:hypothetical protein
MRGAFVAIQGPTISNQRHAAAEALVGSGERTGCARTPMGRLARRLGPTSSKKAPSGRSPAASTPGEGRGLLSGQTIDGCGVTVPWRRCGDGRRAWRMTPPIHVEMSTKCTAVPRPPSTRSANARRRE